MGLFDHFPYTNVHELNLDWVLSMMKALEAEWEAFTAGNSLTFADPMLHDVTKTYAKNTIVLDDNGNAYVSLQAVPVGVGLQNGDYWLMVFDYEAFIEKVNKNFTARYYRGSYRATAAMAIGDWLTVDDILCKATAAIAADDVLEVGVNITHFTLEDFIKAFMQSANQLIQQYKNDIDASELLYRQQLAGDIASTTASLQAQLNAAISGATVDSEVINARVGADGVTYPTLGDAIRSQTGRLNNLVFGLYPQNIQSLIADSYWIASGGSAGTPTAYAGWSRTGFIPCTPGEVLYIKATRQSDYNVFMNSATNGDFNSQFTVSSGDNFITVPSGAYYYGLSNVDSNMNDEEIYQTQIYNDLRSLETNSFLYRNDNGATDFNDFTEIGFYRPYANTLYTNEPTDNGNLISGAKIIFNFAHGTQTIQYLMYLATPNRGRLFQRTKSSGTWGSWMELYNKNWLNKIYNVVSPSNNNKCDTYTFSSQSVQGANTGDRLKIVSYNVAKYNNDTATYISAEQAANLKKMLMSYDADVLGIQEDNQYVDGVSNSSLEYIYYPVYPYKAGSNSVCVHSKTPINSTKMMQYSTGRYIRYTMIGSLLFICTHFSPAAEDIAKRTTELNELFDWINGNITLMDTASNPTSVPSFDHCIICMDSNITDTEESSFISKVHSENYHAANGDTLGWMITYPDLNMHIDNILVSNNVIINKIDVGNSWFEHLYSDHCPVFADVTLL